MKPIRATPAAIERAAVLLRDGGLVAFPSETVYGLGADATNPTAVARIFEAKGRPSFDPLIVHLADADWLSRCVDAIPREAEWLAGRFWPGPLTIVLPKQPIIPDIVTAGLATVAVRVPAHPVARKLITKAGVPVAAPSANRFGRISPTTAKAVATELGGKIDMILDGGPTSHGIESTVVGFGPRGLYVLRPGPITREELSDCLGSEVALNAGTALRRAAPGQTLRHYAPTTPLQIVSNAESVGVGSDQKIGLLAFREGTRRDRFEKVQVLSRRGNLREAAANLFASLRALDEAGLDGIIAESVPLQGLGLAIMDRLRKAAADSRRVCPPAALSAKPDRRRS